MKYTQIMGAQARPPQVSKIELVYRNQPNTYAAAPLPPTPSVRLKMQLIALKYSCC